MTAERVDVRVHQILGTADARCAIVGFPFDEGVRRNGGRPGASEGPAAFRQLFSRLTPSGRDFETFSGHCKTLATCHDAGDISTAQELEDGQAELGDWVAERLRRRQIPIVVGGGHETSFGHFLGYAKLGQSVRIINLDAHPDVRPLIDGHGHSGSPFRQALRHESNCLDRYTVVGLQSHSVAREHVEFLESAGGRCYWREQVTAERVGSLFEEMDGPTMVTMDLDAVDQAFAPGVSAPAVGGFGVDLWVDAAFQAGRCPHVSSFDVVELNPRFDRDMQTARLAALTVWHFLRGVAVRGSGVMVEGD